MFEFLLAACGLAGSLAAALTVFFRCQGDCCISLEAEAAREFSYTLSAGGRELLCRCQIPLTNHGRQQGMLLNVFCQVQYFGKVMDQLAIVSYLRLLRHPRREDGYWEAVIIKKESTHMAELVLKLRSEQEILQLLPELPRLDVLVHYQTVGRSGIQWRVAEVSFDLRRLKSREVKSE
jgi:hypothetical protein